MPRSSSPVLTLALLATGLGACSSTVAGTGPDTLTGTATSETDDGGATTSTYAATCATTPSTAICEGAAAPEFALLDVQPKSPRHGERYGLEAFRGKVTVVALLAGWCHYCQSQTQRLELLRRELAAEGHDVDFVTINGVDAANDQAQLVGRCAFPILQDHVGAAATFDTGSKKTAWQLLGGKKDDMLVYDAEGKLAKYLPFNGSANTNLSTPDGYQGLKATILAVR